MYNLRQFTNFTHKQFRSGIVAALWSFGRARSSISVEPSSSLIDDKVRIVVSGLQARQAVTLEARILAENGEVFESHAHFIACKDGEVDVCSDASLGGSYTGVSPMGLFNMEHETRPGTEKGTAAYKERCHQAVQRGAEVF